MVGVGGRDDGDDDVTKNTYENADDAMSIGAKRRTFAVEATRLHRRRKAFEKKKNKKRKQRIAKEERREQKTKKRATKMNGRLLL